MCCLAGRLTDAANGFGVVCSSILGYVIVSIEAKLLSENETKQG